jgi:hypothetical protein
MSKQTEESLDRSRGWESSSSCKQKLTEAFDSQDIQEMYARGHMAKEKSPIPKTPQIGISHKYTINYRSNWLPCASHDHTFLALLFRLRTRIEHGPVERFG